MTLLLAADPLTLSAEVQAGSAVATVVLTLVLAILTWRYVRLTRQLSKSAQVQNSGSTHERLYNQNHAVLQVLVAHPELRPYFYERKSPSEHPCETERQRIRAIAEMFAGFMEQIALHLPDLPKTVKGAWQTYIQAAYEASPAIQEYFHNYGNWYSDVLARELPVGAMGAGAVGGTVKPAPRV